MPILEGACPRCNISLHGLDHQGVVPLVCPACRGVFLRGADLKPHFGPTGTGLLACGELTYNARRPRLPCPVGCATMDQKVVPTPAIRLELDQCPGCHGIWFDRGEINAVFNAARLRPVVGAPASARASAQVAAARRVDQVDKAANTSDDTLGVKDSSGWWLFSFLTQLPLEGYNPLFRAPVMVWTLIALCAGAFALELATGGTFVRAFALIPQQLTVEHTGLVSLFTSMFLHAGFAHLLGNMYFLKIFGDNVEDRMGRGVFVAFYLACGVAAGLVHVATDPSSPIPTIGASGAIAGVMAAYLVFFPDVRIGIAPSLLTFFRIFKVRTLFYLPAWFGWQFVAAAISKAPVAWWAHIGGFAAGLLLSLLVRSVVLDARVHAAAEAMTAT